MAADRQPGAAVDVGERMRHLRLMRHLAPAALSLPAARALSAKPGTRRRSRLMAMWLLRPRSPSKG